MTTEVHDSRFDLSAVVAHPVILKPIKSPRDSPGLIENGMRRLLSKVTQRQRFPTLFRCPIHPSHCSHLSYLIPVGMSKKQVSASSPAILLSANLHDGTRFSKCMWS